MILKNHYGSWCPSGTLHEHFMDIFMNILLIFWIGDERWVLEGSREFGCCNWVALSGCFVGLLCQDAPPGCFVGLLCRVALRGSVRLCGGFEYEGWAMWCSCCYLPFLVFLN